MKTVVAFLSLLQLAMATFCAHAVLPEPDNVIYGTIVRNGLPITAADFDVVIEVRRTAQGPAIASYTMGSNARLRDFYSVRVPLESLSPKTDANAFVTGEMLYLVVTDSNGQLAATNIVTGPRGAFSLINLGGSINHVVDIDGDGLPDAWELSNGIVGDGGGDKDGDGATDRHEYIAGTDPNNPDDQLRVAITLVAPNKLVSFVGRRAEGIGYANRDRYFALETSTNLGGLWFDVPGYTNILGQNATVTYTHSAPLPTNAHYRARVWLQSQ